MPQLKALGLSSLTPQVLSFFSTHGIATVEDFLVHDIYMLVSFTDYQSNSKLLKEAVSDVLSYLEQKHVKWYDGCGLRDRLQESTQFLSTGCESVDSLLCGGFQTGTITELVGAFASGKTQMCMQAATVAVLNKASVLYIDTCNSFSPYRLVQFFNGLQQSQRYQEQINMEEAFNHIHCHKAFDIFELLGLLNQLNTCLDSQIEEPLQLKNVKLLIIDSISSVISPALSNSYVQGHGLMMSVAQVLKNLAWEKNLAILLTNHTVAGEAGVPKPALGETWKTTAQVRLLFTRDLSDSVCYVSLLKHAFLACNMTKVPFILGEQCQPVA